MHFKRNVHHTAHQVNSRIHYLVRKPDPYLVLVVINSLVFDYLLNFLRRKCVQHLQKLTQLHCCIPHPFLMAIPHALPQFRLDLDISWLFFSKYHNLLFPFNISLDFFQMSLVENANFLGDTLTRNLFKLLCH